MPVLALQFVAPLQSWGDTGVYGTRKTLHIPTKSAVIGMIAGALGRKRGESLEDLRELKMGIRVDQQGSIFTDFQTAESVSKEDLLKVWTLTTGQEKYPVKLSDKTEKYIARKEYLTDAIFLVVLSHNSKEFLNEIATALKNPIYPVHFGRRNCVPMDDVVLSVLDDTMLNALYDTPWLAHDWYKKRYGKSSTKLPVYAEGVPKDLSVRKVTFMDTPSTTFAQNDRRFEPRRFYELKPVQVIKKDVKSHVDFFEEV